MKSIFKDLFYLLVFAGFSFLIVQSNSEYPQIQINQIYQVNLKASENIIYSFIIPDLNPQNQSLFIQVQSPYNDPYQQPVVIVTSDKDYEQICSQNSNQFSGICQIPSEQLSPKRQFKILIECFKQCNLKFSAYLSKLIQLNFGYKYQIQALVQFGIVEQIQIQIPSDLQFTQIAILAKIQNFGDIEQGMEMYANIGDKSIDIPTQFKHEYKGGQVWGDRTGIFLSKQQIHPGDVIKLYLIIGEGVKLQLYSQSLNGNKYSIGLNTGYDDFTTYNENRIYVLNLSDIIKANSSHFMNQENLQIIFSIYSGDPVIDIAFDQNFTNQIDNNYLQGTFSFLITPQIRSLNNFIDTIYIKVSSYWSSNYYFIAFLNSNEYIQLDEGVTLIDQAQPGQIKNYMYQATQVFANNQSTIVDFNLKITLIKGGAQVGIQRCRSLQENSTLQCLIKNFSQLLVAEQNAALSQITTSIRQQFNTYELYFSYNFMNCPLKQNFGIYAVYKCEFDFIVLPAQSEKQKIKYSIDIYPRTQIKGLKEGYIFKEFIFKEQYLYFQFDLPNLDQVEQVVFYLTILAGDAAILATTNQQYKYMELDMAFKTDDIQFSLYNSIMFPKSQIAKSFFIGIYGYDAAQFTLSVTVKRSQSNIENNATNNSTQNISDNNNTNKQSTIISLKQQLTQQYAIKKNQKQINFSFQVKKAGNYTIQIIEIQGIVTFSAYYYINNTISMIQCSSTSNNDKNKCIFLAQPNNLYYVDVKGDQNSTQIFSISYFEVQSCKRYLLNVPQFVFLAAKTTSCSSFSINPSTPITIMTSFSTIDILTTNLKFSASFNNASSIQFEGRQRKFSKDQIVNLCKSSIQNNCQMKISIQGDANQNIQFNFVVQQENKQQALFDGIVRKVIDQNMTKTNGKFFYYGVGASQQSIKIFITSKDNVGYYIGAKFVQQDSFLASLDSLYLPYDSLNDGDSLIQNENIFQTNLRAQIGTTVLFIPHEDYKQYCKYCVLLISVYGLDDSSKEANIFQIEVTQTQSYMYLGMQKIGFLSEGQIYVYQISGNPDQESLLNIRDLHQQSLKDNSCFTVDIQQKISGQIWTIYRGYQIIKKTNKNYRVFLQNQISDICSYQISYSALNSPISTLTQYMSVQVDNRNNETSYFLYFHNSNFSFQLLQYIKSGDSKLFCNRIDINNTIQALLQKNLELFEFKSEGTDSFLQIKSSTDSSFCVNCYYLIAVKGNPNVVSELIVAQQTQPIGLSTYGILKQSLKQSKIENYVFYSIYTFNISISLIYGQISVQIQSPDGKSVYKNKILTSTQIIVAHSNLTDGQYFDYYDKNSQFKIKIKAERDSAYFIYAKKKNINLRIYEGVPVKFQTQTNCCTTLQFINIENKKTISFLIQVESQIDQLFDITLTAEAIIQQSTQGKNLPVNIQKKTRSQNSFNFQIDSVKGTYFINIKTSKPVTLTAILVSKKLTHLMITAVNLFTSQGTFQIYTPGKNVMIVIDSCIGQVQVKASDNYTKLQSDDEDDQIILQHANYGGHYIISTQNLKGEYFIQTSSKIQNSSLGYIISYYYYNKGDIIPYKKLDVVPQISYELTSEQIKFILNPVQLLSSKTVIKIQPTYELYIGTSDRISNLNAKCGIQTGFSLSQRGPSDSKQKIKFSLSYKQIEDIIGKQTNVYYVSAKVRVKLLIQGADQNYPQYIDLAYTSTQITQSHHKVQFKEEDNLRFVLMWIVVPFLISAFMLIIALKFCIKKYRELYPTQLVEEDVNWGQTDQAIQNPNSDSIQYKAS